MQAPHARGWVLHATGCRGQCWPRSPSICISAAERGTVTHLFLTGWGGRAGIGGFLGYITKSLRGPVSSSTASLAVAHQ